MILPTHTEEQILKELIADYAIVKRIVKKKTAVFFKKLQKQGKFLRENYYESYEISTVNGNKWSAHITYNQTNKVPWYFYACCIVEGEKKSKDYYVVRGLNTEKPYFIKFTTHALKRFRERNNILESTPLEFLATHAFAHKETPIASAFMDIKLQLLMGKMEDETEMQDLSYIVLCNIGVFYAYKTPLNNWVFKTYVSTKMAFEELENAIKKKHTKYHDEGVQLYYILHVHQYFNKFLYDKETLDNMLYKEVGKDYEFELKETNMVIALKH